MVPAYPRPVIPNSLPIAYLADDSDDQDIPLHDLPTPAARVPFQPLLFSLCHQGDPGIWTGAWSPARIEAYFEMSSLYNRWR